MCDQIAAEGVPADRLHIGSGFYDTISNIKETVTVARELGVSRVDLITDPAQALRARLFLPVPAGGTQLEWTPYDYLNIEPKPTILTLWWRVHHEWLGIVSLLLPDETRSAILARIRGQLQPP